MTPCVTCGDSTVPTEWGPWCDTCGGVCVVPNRMIFRHVATVYGPGGRFPIVFDYSTSDYAYMFKDPNPPSHNKDEDGFSRPSVRVAHGSLDAMIAISHPDVAAPGEYGPFVSASPASTREERELIGV